MSDVNIKDTISAKRPLVDDISSSHHKRSLEEEDDHTTHHKRLKDQPGSVPLAAQPSKKISFGLTQKPAAKPDAKIAFSGFKMGTQKPVAKLAPTNSVQKSKSTVKAVAAAFGASSDEEDGEEEMPPEAKMRMKNIGRNTPTSAGPNSFGKFRMGFCDTKNMFERQLKEAQENKDD